MQSLVIVFIVIVGATVVLSSIVFGVIFFRTARFTGKVFRHAQRELDRQASASEPLQPVVCILVSPAHRSGQWSQHIHQREIPIFPGQCGLPRIIIVQSQINHLVPPP